MSQGPGFRIPGSGNRFQDSLRDFAVPRGIVIAFEILLAPNGSPGMSRVQDSGNRVQGARSGFRVRISGLRFSI